MGAEVEERRVEDPVLKKQSRVIRVVCAGLDFGYVRELAIRKVRRLVR